MLSQAVSTEAVQVSGMEIGQWVACLIASGNLHEFYTSPAWERLRAEVLRDDRYECQHCKARGYYARANTVHHVKRLREHPGLALSRYYIDEHGNRQRQLVSVCFACHEKEHKIERGKEKELLTPERW